MSYLFIEKWADFSVLNENSRGYVSNPVFLMYASIIQKSCKATYYINVEDDKITKEGLLNYVKVKCIETVIFLVDSDNINSIQRIISDLDNKIGVVLLSINEDLNYYIQEQDERFKYIMYDEKLSIESNLCFFIESLRISLDLEYIKHNATNYSLLNNSRSKIAIVNIGSGCKAKCSFCNIASSELNYRPIDTLMREIVNILNSGIKFFHIANHSFSCDRKFIEDFCTQLNLIKQNYDFAWSCYIIPAFFVENIDLLLLMANSNLKKIELGCESGDEELLRGMKLQHSPKDVKNIIFSAVANNIVLFSAHFIIGSPNESEKTLIETKKYILELLDLTDGICDIHIHCFFPMNDTRTKKSNEVRNKKSDFLLENGCLKIAVLKQYKKKIDIDIKLKRAELKNQITFQRQHELFLLEKKYHIVSQIGRDYFAKTRNYGLFAQKEAIKHAYYSWEIMNDYSDYSLVYNFGTFVTMEKLKSDCSNFHVVLENYIRSGYSINDIVEAINRESNGNITKETIHFMIKKMESQYGLYFIKYLK